jgi:hypothetical protein
MLFSCHERKNFIRKLILYIYIYIYVRSHQCCASKYILNVCVKYKMVGFNMCVIVGSIPVRAYAFRNA